MTTLNSHNIPPTYADLGKAARDLFEKGYNYGSSKIDLKTRTKSGIEFTTKGSSSHDTNKITASLESKYKQPKHGFTFTEKWTTDNNLSTEVSLEDQIAKGLKLTLFTSFAPSTGKKAGSLKTGYKRDYMNINLDTDFDFAGPTLNGAAVIGYQSWLVGYQFGYDTSKSSLTKNNVAVGYSGSDFQLFFNCKDTSEFGGSIYHATSSKLSTGVQLAWNAGQSNTRFGIAAKYIIDADATLNTKLNNVGQLGVGYSHLLREGIKLNLSGLIDAKNFNAGGHKLGFGLEFEV